MESSQFLSEQKAKLRKELRKKLMALTPEDRETGSRAILKQLFRHPRFLASQSVLIYLALETEVETRPILQEAQKRGKKVYAPRLDPVQGQIGLIEMKNFEELRPGPYGILEPPFDAGRLGDPKNLDLAVVPGIGFDRSGGRLGRGKGHFDRFLRECGRAYKIGLAFECQIVEKVPRAAHDVVLDEILIG